MGIALENIIRYPVFPSGAVNRHIFPQIDADRILTRSGWAVAADEMAGLLSPVNVGATSSYNASTKELTVDVEAFYTESASASVNFIHVSAHSGFHNG